MKRIIILAIATLSTGVVLSSNLKKAEVVKPAVLDQQKSMQQKNADKMQSMDVVAQGD